MAATDDKVTRLKTFRDCACGADANGGVCSDVLQLVQANLGACRADANTWRVAGDDVHKILAGAGVAQDEPYVFTDPKLYAEWAYVGELDTVLAETDAVPVAVGSGVINDLTKLCSSHNGRRYMVVGTAASMDGYTAYGLRSPRTATSRLSIARRRWGWCSTRTSPRLRLRSSPPRAMPI